MGADGDGLPPVAVGTRYVRFPPRWRNVLVPTGPAAATAMGMTLYTACNPIPVAAQQALWSLARLTRGRAVLGPRETWTPPVEPAAFDELWAQWRRTVGRPIDGVAVYERIQAERAGLTMLLCAGRGSVLVRVRRDATEIELEQRISAAAERQPPTTFRVPRLAGVGSTAGWSWVAYEAIARRPHRPLRELPPSLEDEVAALVESVVDRPPGVAGHWRGAHGDLTPWNLRRSHTGTWLIDWEDATWLPPGADQLYFEAVSAAIRSGPVHPLPAEGREEARAHWLQVLSSRTPAPAEVRLHERLELLLGGR